MANIIGRKEEQKELQRLYESNSPEFVAVYGRRRVGKTFLIREMFRDSMTFYHTGLSVYDDGSKVSTEEQLRHFYHSLQMHDSDADHAPKSWIEAMYMLEELLMKLDNGSRQVVFIDELPWLDTPRSHFITALEAFWNGWGAGRDNLMLIVCGSAASWMIKNLINNTGGLYNRLTCEIKLSPFNLCETEEYLRSRQITASRYDIAMAYMAFGGIPYYLSYFQKGLSMAQNIDLLFFDRKAKLRMEFKRLFTSLYKYPEKYEKVINILSTRHYGYTREELAKIMDIPLGGSFSDILNALAASDFIMAYKPIDAKKGETLYKLVDPFCRFSMYFADKALSGDSQYWLHNVNSPNVMSWSGIAFEELCIMHTEQIKRKLGIAAVRTSEAPYTLRGDEHHDGMQCDLVIERGDRVVNLCEMKFSQGKYEITKSYDMTLRHRINAIMSRLKNTQTLQLTFITTFGVKHNMYSGIVQSEVTLDDLFV